VFLSTILLVTHRAFLAAHPGPAGWGERPEWRALRDPREPPPFACAIAWGVKEVWAVGWERPGGWNVWAPYLPSAGTVIRLRPWARGTGELARVVEVQAIPLADELVGHRLYRARVERAAEEFVAAS
jgi:hypothetical protein